LQEEALMIKRLILRDPKSGRFEDLEPPRDGSVKTSLIQMIRTGRKPKK
jgi:hypothetical protein